MHYVNETIKKQNLDSSVDAADNEESILVKLLRINKQLAIVMCADSLMAGK